MFGPFLVSVSQTYPSCLLPLLISQQCVKIARPVAFYYWKSEKYSQNRKDILQTPSSQELFQSPFYISYLVKIATE